MADADDITEKECHSDYETPKRKKLLQRVSFFERVWKGAKVIPSDALDEAVEAFEFVTEETFEGPFNEDKDGGKSKRRRTENSPPVDSDGEQIKSGENKRLVIKTGTTHRRVRTKSPVVIVREYEFVDAPRSVDDVDELEKRIAERRHEVLDRTKSPTFEWQNIKLTPRRQYSSSEDRIITSQIPFSSGRDDTFSSPSPSSTERYTPDFSQIDSPSPIADDNTDDSATSIASKGDSGKSDFSKGAISKINKQSVLIHDKPSSASSDVNEKIMRSHTTQKCISSTYIGKRKMLENQPDTALHSPRKEGVLMKDELTLQTVLESTKASGRIEDETDTGVQQHLFTVSYGETVVPEITRSSHKSKTLIHIEGDGDGESDTTHPYRTYSSHQTVDNISEGETFKVPPEHSFKSEYHHESDSGKSHEFDETDEPVSMESVSSIVCDGGVRRYSSKVIIRERDSFTKGKEAYSNYLKKTRQSLSKTAVTTSEVLSTIDGSTEILQKNLKHDYQEHISTMKGKKCFTDRNIFDIVHNT